MRERWLLQGLRLRAGERRGGGVLLYRAGHGEPWFDEGGRSLSPHPWGEGARRQHSRKHEIHGEPLRSQNACEVYDPLACQGAAKWSPSPWGEGWGEGDRRVHQPKTHGEDVAFHEIWEE